MKYISKANRDDTNLTSFNDRKPIFIQKYIFDIMDNITLNASTSFFHTWKKVI